jgi:hypothetical protein
MYIGLRPLASRFHLNSRSTLSSFLLLPHMIIICFINGSKQRAHAQLLMLVTPYLVQLKKKKKNQLFFFLNSTLSLRGGRMLEYFSYLNIFHVRLFSILSLDLFFYIARYIINYYQLVHRTLIPL